MLNQESIFDVIIIGAGPAGLKCAIELGGSNLSVLLIEKNEDIVEKVCGGGLTGLVPESDYPASKTKKFEKQIVHFKGKRHEIPLAIGLKTINRVDLEQYLFSKLDSVFNVTILKNTAAVKIEEGKLSKQRFKIYTEGGIFYGKHLVGADGSSSIVRKYLGLPFKILIGMRHRSLKLMNELAVFFNSKLLLASGYLWIFPHIDHTNIGIGFDPKIISPASGKKMLVDFLEKNNLLNYHSINNIDKDLECAPINYLYRGCVFKNIYLVGDAAGFVSKATGEGILPALISGGEIARKILNPDYQMPGLKRILEIKKRQEKFRKILELLPFGKIKFFETFINLLKRKEFQLYYFGVSRNY